MLPFLNDKKILIEAKKDIIEKIKKFEQEKKSLDYQKEKKFIKNKNILFIDFNGVISYQPFWASLSNPKHKYHQYFSQIEEFIFKENTELVKDWMLGKYSSEQIHQLVAEKVNIPYEDILKIFIEDCQNLDISKAILERVKNLRPYYYCILATDNMDSFDRFTLTSNPELIESFDEINNSSVIGIFKSKDNGQYFKDKISQRNAVIENSILIDDSKSNCKVFYSINGQAHNTKNEREVVIILEKILKKVKSKWEAIIDLEAQSPNTKEQLKPLAKPMGNDDAL